MDTIVELITKASRLLARGSWRRFLLGYLLVWAAMFVLCYLLGQHTPLHKKLDRFDEVVQWVCLSLGSLFLASLVVTIIMRIYSQVASLKAVWDAKLRTLDRLHSFLTKAVMRLQHEHETGVTTPDPITSFCGDIRWAFLNLSTEVEVFTDMARQGIDGVNEDEACLEILQNMRDLQNKGQQIVSMVQKAATPDEKIAKAIEEAIGTCAAIIELQNKCKKTMKRKGLRPISNDN